MKTHHSRPLTDELEELYRIAVREHGPYARSARLIGDALADCRREQREGGRAAPLPRVVGPRKLREGPG